MTVHRIKVADKSALQVAPRMGLVHLQLDHDRGTHVHRPMQLQLTPEQTAALIFALEMSLEELDTRASVGFIPAAAAG